MPHRPTVGWWEWFTELGLSAIALWLGLVMAYAFFEVLRSPTRMTYIYEPNRLIATSELLMGLVIVGWAIERIAGDIRRWW